MGMRPSPTCTASHPHFYCALAGIEELRAAVRWADATAESRFEGMTAEQVLAEYRRVRDED